MYRRQVILPTDDRPAEHRVNFFPMIAPRADKISASDGKCRIAPRGSRPVRLFIFIRFAVS